MAEELKTFLTGNGAKVEIVALQLGDTAYPERIAITATALSAKNAATVTISASCAIAGQTLKLPSGASYPFTDPITGAEVMVTLTAAANIALSTGSGPYTGTGTLTVDLNHLAVANNSTSSNFIPLGSRSTATATITLADEQLRTFDSALFDQGQVVGAAGEFTCDGAYSPIDAGSNTVSNLTKGATAINGTTVISLPGSYMWLVVTTPPPAAGYSTGLVIRAIVYCTDLTIDVQAGAITKQSLPFKANGTVYTDSPKVA